MTWHIAPLAFVALGLAAIAWHFVGLRLRWYKSLGGYWWFDETAHFLSGAALMLGLVQLPGPWWLPWGLFIAAVAGWEVWEYAHGDPEDLWHSCKNMVHDLMSGGLAALLVWVIV